MREIKFRAYVFADKKMYNVLSVSGRFANEDFNRIFIAKESLPGQPTNLRADSKNAALMQFTGLSDKNEKDIYEGDIIRFTYWWFDGSERDSILEGVIEYDAAAMSFQLKQINNEFFENHTGYEKGKGALCFGELRFTEEDFEVIGNVYENKELIKQYH